MLLVTVGVASLGTPAGAQDPTQPPAQPRPVPARADTVRDSVKAKIPVPVRPDSAKIDSVHGITDTTKTKVRRDSIQAPLARPAVPRPIDVRPAYRWTRDSVFSTGAVNLTDLLERVPGVTIFRSGFLASAQTAAYRGDVARVRVFRDGLELDGLDPRTGTIPDLADIQLANLDDITIEPAPGEIRVHLRSWTVRNTTPYTRVDAFTGDEETNLYRFFYGRRFGNGFAAQLGVQQFGTGARNRRTGGGGSVLDAMGRVGWAKGDWSVDLTGNRLDRDRDLTLSFVGQDSLLRSFKGRRNEATLRAAFRDPESTGLWAQVLATSTSLRLTGTGFRRPDTTKITRTTRIDTVTTTPNPVVDTVIVTTATVDTLVIPDSSASRHQYVAMAGYTFGPVRVSGGDRFRRIAGTTYSSPFARGEFVLPKLLSVTGYLDVDDVEGYEVLRLPTARKGILDTTGSVRGFGGKLVPPSRASHIDVSAQFTPLRWFSLSGGFGRISTSRYGYDTTGARLRQTLTLPVPGTPPTTRTATRDTAFVPTLVAIPDQPVTTMRAEALVRVGRLWVGGGRVQRSAAYLRPPIVYDVSAVADTVRDPAVGATIVSARGPVWKDVYADVNGTMWDSDGFYRPKEQVRGEVGVSTNWLSRFPTGNFGFKFAIIDNYRGRTRFPAIASDSSVRYTGAANQLDVQLEIRIMSGTLNYQLRNALGRKYETVPGFTMPGPINFYGLRWTFWN